MTSCSWNWIELQNSQWIRHKNQRISTDEPKTNYSRPSTASEAKKNSLIALLESDWSYWWTNPIKRPLSTASRRSAPPATVGVCKWNHYFRTSSAHQRRTWFIDNVPRTDYLKSIPDGTWIRPTIAIRAMFSLFSLKSRSSRTFWPLCSLDSRTTAPYWMFLCWGSTRNLIFIEFSKEYRFL